MARKVLIQSFLVKDSPRLNIFFLGLLALLGAGLALTTVSPVFGNNGVDNETSLNTLNAPLSVSHDLSKGLFNNTVLNGSKVVLQQQGQNINAWNVQNSIPISMTWLGAAQYNGYIYIVGGKDTSSVKRNEVYVSNIGTNGQPGSWATTTALPVSAASVAVAAYDDYLYAIGGREGSDPLTTTYYAPINANGTIGNWLETTPLPEARYGLGTVVVKGYIYIMGYGYGGASSDTVHYAAINPDGTIGNWTTSTLPGATQEPGMAVSGNRIYLNRNHGGSGVGCTDTVYSALVSDNGSLTWRTENPHPNPTIDTARMVSINGQLFILGGGDCGGVGWLSTAYRATVNNDQTVTWEGGSETGLPAQTWWHNAVGYQNYLYVLGGTPNHSTPNGRNTVFWTSLITNSTYAYDGSYLSPVIDLGTIKPVETITWQPQANGQTISLQYRTATGSSWGAWNSLATASTIQVNETTRYVQYRVELSSDGTSTPSFENVNIQTNEGCIARVNTDPTNYYTVQAAIDAASVGDTVKVAGTCTGVANRSGTDQTAYISKSLTLRGGYTTTNWTTSNPVANPTTLDAQQAGRVLYITGDITPTIAGLTVTGGSYNPSGGGGIYVENAHPEMNNLTISGNQITGNCGSCGGAGISLNNADNTKILSTLIQNNSAFLSGGGIYIYNGTSKLLIENTDIISNETTGSNSFGGGGIRWEATASNLATLRNVTIQNNKSVGKWGGAQIVSDGATLENVVIANNSATYSHGGLYIFQSNDVSLRNVSVLNNTASSYGGLYFHGSNAILEQITAEGNQSSSSVSGFVGGLFLDNFDNGILRDSIIRNNYAGNDGGGLYIASTSNTYTVQNTLIANNSIAAVGHASGVWLHGTQGTLSHVTIANNSGGNQQGIEVYGTGHALKNVIVAGHTTNLGVGSGADITLDKVVFLNNSYTGAGTITDNDSQLCDPAFTDAANGDYSLSNSSCALAYGTDLGISTDLAGNSRPNPVGTNPDVGAYENGFVPLTAVSVSGPISDVTGQSLTFSSIYTPDNATTPINYSWSNDGSGSCTPQGTTYLCSWATPGSKHVAVTADNGGQPVSSGNHLVSISPAVTAPTMVSLSGPLSGTIGQSLPFTALVSPVDVTLPLTYSWQVAGEAPQQIISSQISHTLSLTWSMAGAQQLTVTVENEAGQVTSNQHALTLYTPVQAAIVAQPSTGPAPLTVTLTNTVTGDYDQLQLDFGDGSQQSLLNPTTLSHSYLQPGLYTVSLTASGLGGQDVVSTVIGVGDFEPIAAFEIITNSTANPLEVCFTNHSQFYSASAWNFGDGTPPVNATKLAADNDPCHTYAQGGSYTISLNVIGSGGTDQVSHSVTVYPDLAVSFIYQPTSPLCGAPAQPLLGEPVRFIISATEQVSSTWDFGDGQTLSNQAGTVVSHTYQTTGTKSVQVLVTGAGGRMATSPAVPLTVYQQAGLTMQLSPPQALVNDPVQLRYQAMGDYGSVDLDCGYTTRQPRQAVCRYPDPGLYTATVSLTGVGCPVSTSQLITISRAVVADFTLSSQTGIVPPAFTISLTDTSVGRIISRTVAFGDGQILTHTPPLSSLISHAYSQPGDYRLQLTVWGENGTNAQKETDVTMYQRCVAAFTTNPVDLSGESPFAVQFLDRSSGDCDPMQRRWTFGDGTASSLENPAKTFHNSGATAQSFVVTLAMGGHGGQDTAQQTITVQPRQVISPVNVVISPAAPQKQDDLTVNYDCSGLSNLCNTAQPVFQWYRHVANLFPVPPPVPQAFSTSRIPYTTTQESECWTVEVSLCTAPTACGPVGQSNRVCIVDTPNSPPQVQRVVISPTSPLKTDDLQLLYTLDDADGPINDSSQTIIRWTTNNKPQHALRNQQTIAEVHTQPEQSWCVTVQPHDGEAFGNPSLPVCVTIAAENNNHAPQVLTPTIGVIQLNQKTRRLTLNYAYFDFDADAQGERVTERKIRWSRNNLYHADYRNQAVITPNVDLVDGIWQAEIQVFDGQTYSRWTATDPLEVDTYVNTPPYIRTTPPPRIEPTVPSPDDDLQLIFEYGDVDGHPMSNQTEILWFNGPQQTTAVFSGATMVPASMTALGQHWSARIRPHDTISYGQWIYVNSVPITGSINRPPQARTVRIEPQHPSGNPGEKTDLELFYEFFDPDDDDEGATEIRWSYTAGTVSSPVPRLNDQSIVSADRPRPNDEWCATITPVDERGLAGQSETACVTVAEYRNSPPYLNGIPYISPAIAATEDDLTLRYDYKDDDGHKESRTEIRWTRLRSGQSQAISQFDDLPTVPASATERGDTWQATIRVHDGINYSQPYDAETSYINHPPEIAEIGFVTAEVRGCQAVDLDYRVQDRDARHLSLSSQTRWHLNQQHLDSYDDSTSLPEKVTTQGQELTVAVTPHDGYEPGPTVSSTTTIGRNGPPCNQAHLPLLMRMMTTPKPQFIPSRVKFLPHYATPCEPDCPTRTVLLRNPSEATLTIDDLTVDNDPDFSLRHDCPAQLAPRGSCQLTVTFHPASVGPKGAVVTLSGSQSATLALVGEGVAQPIPYLFLAQNSLSFAETMVSRPPASQTLTLENQGQAPLTELTILLESENFRLLHNGCAPELPAGETCQLHLGFTPTTAGPHQTELTIASNDAASPHSVTLRGTGLPNPCSEAQRFEPNNDRPQACPLPVGQTIVAYPDDSQDFYTFSLSQTTPIALSIEKFNPNGVPGGQFQLYHETDQVTVLDEITELAGTACLPRRSITLQPGQYWVVVYSHNPTPTGDPYRLTLSPGATCTMEVPLRRR